MARLDRDAVVGAAVALADEAGLESVSLRRVAERLEVTPMALYRHVGGKEGLLDAMAESMYARLALPSPGPGWWESLAGMARSTREVLLTRPWAVPLFGRPLAGPYGQALDDALRVALLSAGFSAAEAGELHDQLAGMVFALITPELAGKPNRAAFERGLELLRDGLEARLARALSA
jgi:AcrR family transcriptional regulator